MQALVAIARLTFKAAFRFRLVPVLLTLLLGAVLLLPAVIKDDGTARGLTQIVLTYNLGLITAVLGLTTLWLACGTLAREIEECQIQVVAVKPVARWQIWLGKWLGILFLNALMLAISTGAVYVQLQWRAKKLPPEQREVLNQEIFVARGSLREPMPDLEPTVERLMAERIKSNEALARMPPAELRRLLREQLKARLQVVPPGMTRRWQVNVGLAKQLLRDKPMFLRIKFFAAEKPPSGTLTAIWEAGPPESPRRARAVLSQAPETFHECSIPANLFDDRGILTVEFTNPNDTAVLFPLEDGFEVLYREGGFALNYFRGVAIVFCWMALLAALGLAASSFLSFPVAAFVSLGLLVVAFSTGTMKTIIEQGTILSVNPDTGMADEPTVFDTATVLVFKGLLGVVNMVRGFSPIDSLSTGRSISWWQLIRAILQIVVVMGGLFAALGMSIFTKRELATAGQRG
ncbi:MAG: hypothetical protein QHJ82_04170 [Verrucomicrobiota bacterium]|nr:hypothetical protein [Verrucomicrobiota bacterium]